MAHSYAVNVRENYRIGDLKPTIYQKYIVLSFPGGITTFVYPFSETEMYDISKIILSKTDVQSIKFVLNREYVITKKSESIELLYYKLMIISFGSDEWNNIANRLEELFVNDLDSSLLIKYLDIINDCGEFLKQAIDNNYEKLEKVFMARHLSYATAKTWYLKHETKLKLKSVMIETYNKCNTLLHQELFEYIAECLNIKCVDSKLIYKSLNTGITHDIDLDTMLDLGMYEYISQYIIDWFNKYS